jgi:hypothetical protein
MKLLKNVPALLVKNIDEAGNTAVFFHLCGQFGAGLKTFLPELPVAGPNSIK